MKILEDNNFAIMLSKKGWYHARIKHIDTRFHFIRDCVDDFIQFCHYVYEK